MKDVLKDGTEQELRDLKDFINLSEEFDKDVKDQLIETIEDELRTRNLQDLMKPLVQEFIKEREGGLK